MRERGIFAPLGMVDTGFWVDAAKKDRVTNVHTYGPDKKIMTAPNQSNPTRKPVFLSGGGGLLSTTSDYLKFAQMVLSGGQANGKRYLKSSTVELMRTNVLARASGRSLRADLQHRGHRLRPRLRDHPGSGEGEEHRKARTRSSWAALSRTWFWIFIPTNDLIVIGNDAER